MRAEPRLRGFSRLQANANALPRFCRSGRLQNRLRQDSDSFSIGSGSCSRTKPLQSAVDRRLSTWRESSLLRSRSTHRPEIYWCTAKLGSAAHRPLRSSFFLLDWAPGLRNHSWTTCARNILNAGLISCSRSLPISSSPRASPKHGSTEALVDSRAPRFAD